MVTSVGSSSIMIMTPNMVLIITCSRGGWWYKWWYKWWCKWCTYQLKNVEYPHFISKRVEGEGVEGEDEQASVGHDRDDGGAQVDVLPGADVVRRDS